MPRSVGQWTRSFVTTSSAAITTSIIYKSPSFGSANAEFREHLLKGMILDYGIVFAAGNAAGQFSTTVDFGIYLANLNAAGVIAVTYDPSLGSTADAQADWLWLSSMPVCLSQNGAGAGTITSYFSPDYIMGHRVRVKRRIEDDQALVLAINSRTNTFPAGPVATVKFSLFVGPAR